MTGALVDWLKEYPGDLCDPEATRLFKAILAHVVDYFFMAHLTVELIMIEDGIPIYTDFDISWSLKPASSFNPDTNTNINAPQELVIDSMYELDIMSPTDLDDHEIDTPLKRLGPSAGSLLVDEETSVIMERRLSGSESRVALSSHSDRDKDKKFLIEREKPSEWSAAVGWVMNHDPLEFAAELTRMQWDLFVTIRVSPLYSVSMMKMMADDRDVTYCDTTLGRRKIRLLDRLLLFLIVFRDGKPFLLLDYSAQENNPPSFKNVANDQGLNNDPSLSQTKTPSSDIRTLHPNSPPTPPIEKLRFPLRSNFRNARNVDSSIIPNSPGSSIGSWDFERLAESFEIDGS